MDEGRDRVPCLQDEELAADPVARFHSAREQLHPHERSQEGGDLLPAKCSLLHCVRPDGARQPDPRARAVRLLLLPLVRVDNDPRAQQMVCRVLCRTLRARRPRRGGRDREQHRNPATVFQGSRSEGARGGAGGEHRQPGERGRDRDVEPLFHAGNCGVHRPIARAEPLYRGPACVRPHR